VTRLRGLLLVAAGCAAAGCATTPEPTAPQSRPGALEVEFLGNSSISSHGLERVIEDLLGDFRKDPTRESALVDAALDLKDHYGSEGFPDARITYHLQRTPLRVRFLVTEGPRVTVAELVLTGARAIPADTLRELWSHRRAGLLGTGAALFVEDELRALAGSIKSRYRAEGYLDVVVTGPAVTRGAPGDEARVAIAIDEGTRYAFGQIRIEEELLRHLGGLPAIHSLPGQPMRETELGALRLGVRKHLENLGYPEPRVRVRTERDPTNHTVAVQIDGETGPQATVSGVEIRGNQRTSTDWIRDRIRVEPGKPFHGGRLDESIAALYRSGAFRKVEVQREQPEPGKMRLVFVVDEDEARSVSFLAGYGSYELGRAGVFFADRNLFGLGQTLNAGARVSFKGYRGDLTWTEPMLFASETGLSLSTFYQLREEPSFTDLSLGGTAALRRELVKSVQGRLGYTLEHRDATDVDPSVVLGSDQQFKNGTVFLELTWDTRDSQLFPTTGHRLTVKQERSDPALLGTLTYDRTTAKSALFVDLGADFSLGLAAETGVVWFHDPGALPVQERFFNGGESSVRSFHESELGPQSVSGEPTGGEFRNLGSVELRMPILGPIGAAVFADAGNVGTSVHDYGLRDMRYAVGAGIRLALPVGPLRLDVGINPDRRPGEDTYVIHLSVGFPF
jgi:outer membrane protein insertion porin family